MRNGQTYFDDVTVGTELPALSKGPMTTAHIMRWSAAMENWHKIHYDWRYATEHDKLPDVLINGSWKQHVLVQLLKDWAGPGGWTWKISFQYREMDVPGDVITAFGTVKRTYEHDGIGYVELDIGLRNSRGVESTKGTATVALPRRGGRRVPYPFVPPAQQPGAASPSSGA